MNYKQKYIKQQEFLGGILLKVLLGSLLLIFFIDSKIFVGIFFGIALLSALVVALTPFRCPECNQDQIARTRHTLNKLHFCSGCGARLDQPVDKKPPPKGVPVPPVKPTSGKN